MGGETFQDRLFLQLLLASFGLMGSIFTALFIWIFKRMQEIPKQVADALQNVRHDIDEMMENQRKDLLHAQRRLDVTDRILSKSIGEDFDSRSIVESGHYPRNRRDT